MEWYYWCVCMCCSTTLIFLIIITSRTSNIFNKTSNDITISTIEKKEIVKVRGNAGGGNILLSGYVPSLVQQGNVCMLVESGMIKSAKCYPFINNQIFYSPDNVKIELLGTNQCVTIDTELGVIENPCNGSVSQEFNWTDTGGRIKTKGDTLCLDFGSNPSLNSRIISTPCTFSETQIISPFVPIAEHLPIYD
jgi:hypothetical protein